MRVSKVVREYIEKEVSKKANIQREAVKKTYAAYEAECEAMKEKVKEMTQQLNDDLIAELRRKGMVFCRYNDKLIDCYHSSIQPAMEDEKKKAMHEVSEWEKNAVTEIILTLELGGTKADLERMLKELD